jgi:hypothetical protein
MARNASNQAANWSGGAVNSGILNRGSSDTNQDANAYQNSWRLTSTQSVPSSITDASPYFATGNSAVSGPEQKRTHSLSNGMILWDIAGNTRNWVLDNRSSLGITAGDETAGMTTGTTSFLTSGVNTFSAVGNLLFGSQGILQIDNSKNPGRVVGGTNEGVFRGGVAWSSASGIFHTGFSSSGSDDSNGFRCVFVP